MHKAHKSYSHTKGNYLVATTDIRLGELILEEPPFEAVLYEDAVGRFDHYSFKHGESGELERYFRRNPGHQKLAWKAGHKEECQALASCAPRVIEATVRLAARIFWRRVREARSTDPATRGAYAEVAALENHWGVMDEAEREKLAYAAHVLQKYMEPATSDVARPGGREIIDLLAILQCNAHTVCDQLGQPVGIGLYPKGALINHSDVPNAVQVFQSSCIQFRAVQDISAGEEITIAYIELADTTAARRWELLRSYHFDNAQGSAERLEQVPLFVADEAGQVMLRVWEEQPWPFTDKDIPLTAVQKGGRLDSRSGISVVESNCLPEGHTYRAPFLSMEAPGQPAKEEAIWDRHEHRLDHYQMHVDCWGPAFRSSGGKLREQVASKIPELVLLFFLPRQIDAMMRCHGSHVALAQIRESSRILDTLLGSDWALGPQHVLCLRLLEAKVSALFVNGATNGSDWREAYRTLCRITPIYELCYPNKVWPPLWLHYGKAGKIAALLDDWDAARNLAGLALEGLRCTNWDSEFFLHDMLSVMHEAAIREEWDPDP